MLELLPHGLAGSIEEQVLDTCVGKEVWSKGGVCSILKEKVYCHPKEDK